MKPDIRKLIKDLLGVTTQDAFLAFVKKWANTPGLFNLVRENTMILKMFGFPIVRNDSESVKISLPKYFQKDAELWFFENDDVA